MTRTRRLSWLGLALAVSAVPAAFAESYLVFTDAGIPARGSDVWTWCASGQPCDFAEVLACANPEGSRSLRQQGTEGISGYRNQWNLSLNDQVPMDLKVEIGAGTSDLQLADLSLSGLEVAVGTGETTVDLSGDWTSDFNATVDAGAGQVRVRLPSEVGARVVVETGVGTIDAPDLTRDGDAYTNATYGTTDATLQIDIRAGVGTINLEVVEASAKPDNPVADETANQLQGALQAVVDSPETVFPGALFYASSPELGTWSGGAGLADIEAGTSMKHDVPRPRRPPAPRPACRSTRPSRRRTGA